MTPELIAEYRQMMHENERLRAEVERLEKQLRILQHERDQCVANNIAMQDGADKLEALLEEARDYLCTVIGAGRGLDIGKRISEVIGLGYDPHDE